MSHLFETIKCYNGKLYNLEWHNSRFNRARKVYFGLTNKIDLEEIITIPEDLKEGFFRCRVVYSKMVKQIEFIPHQFRKIESLKLIEDNGIDYRFKYSDRKVLENLFEKRHNCDDIIIVKNGFITDSFTANLIFFDGKKWWTPDTPLLPGTQRAKLIYESKIEVCKIAVDEILNYKRVGLINAMWNFKNMPVVEVGKIQ